MHIQQAGPNTSLTGHGERIRGGEPPRVSIRDCLEGLLKEWNQTEIAVSKQIKSVPIGMRPLLELQLVTHRLQMGVELVTRTAESAAAVIRKAQQSGG